MAKTLFDDAPPAIESGRLLSDAVAQRLSPYHDERPADMDVELIVIHGISLPVGVFGGAAIDALFMGCIDRVRWPELAELCALKVSAHVLIRRDGAIIQYVPFDRRAWHAGESCFGTRSRCNDFSVGIELEGCDDIPYTQVQYEVLAEVICVLRDAYPGIREDGIVGHCDIAPGRKTDPGPAFDWEDLRRRLGSRLAAQP